jgi:GTP-binding protein HflX
VVETGLRTDRHKGGEHAILVAALLPDRPETAEDPLDELARLAETAGAEVVGRVVQRRQRPTASTFVGRGKAEEIAELSRTRDADVIIFDCELSPAQLRNLEKIIGTRVVDRTELILDIFALHARTHTSKLQVELAQAQYLLPRLRRMWTHLNREGGTGQSSAIGTRGPGEKQIEIDRRLLRQQITDRRRELDLIEKRRSRMADSRADYFSVSLVGYTNAGKSTLLRRLTGAKAFVADQLFATLDTKTRAWELADGKRVFLSDTVGFIRNLPHNLVASFYATLEEVRAADLILHVLDASHPDAAVQLNAVEHVLEEIGAHETPRMLVLNKADLVEDALDLRLLANGHEPAVAVSARTGAGIDRLEALVGRHILEGQTEADFRVPAGAGKLLAFLADRGTILERAYDDGMVRLKVRLAKADLARAGRMVDELKADGRATWAAGSESRRA